MNRIESMINSVYSEEGKTLNQELADKIADLLLEGKSPTQISKTLGISRNTFYNYTNPEYRKRQREYQREHYRIRIEDPEYRENYRKRQREHYRIRIEDPEYRENLREYYKKYYRKRIEDPEYRKRQREYYRKYYRKKRSLKNIFDAWEKEGELLTEEQIKERIGHKSGLQRGVKLGSIEEIKVGGKIFYRPIFYSVCDGIFEELSKKFF